MGEWNIIRPNRECTARYRYGRQWFCLYGHHKDSRMKKCAGEICPIRTMTQVIYDGGRS